MRIAAFNVENLFARPKVMGHDWTVGAATLAAYAELNDLFQREAYDDGTKKRMIQLLDQLNILRDDNSEFVRLRKIRGRLLYRPRNKPVEVVADGRASWIGWIELKTQAVDELAMRHTAMVIRDVDADVLGVVEAESRTTLSMFASSLLEEVDATPYAEVMLVDGNDERGIDVGVMTASRYPIEEIRSHVYDTDSEGIVFSRDCCEYHLRLPGDDRLVVLVNHFKSKGYGSADDPIGEKRRTRQAKRVATIYRSLRREGIRHVAVLGDLNDSPDSAALAPLLDGTNLRDISERTDFKWGERRGTFGSGNEKSKFDYVLLSPALYDAATGGGVFRKGVWHGPRTQNPWEIYPTMTREEHAASDHAAIYADIDL
jgi:endonuclease/exonuclease/phosphatase family metal-dependent hydrolase